nr:hypothetical protein [Tanacetum cinerariifolium]
ARIDVGIVHAVFFAAGHAQLNFERHADFGHALEVFFADFDVLLNRLLRQVEHVRAVERLAVLGVEFLAGFEQAVNPGQEFFGRVVGVQNHGYAVGFGHQVHVVRPRNTARNAGLLLVVGQAFASEELGAAIRKLDDNRRVEVAGRFEHGI